VIDWFEAGHHDTEVPDAALLDLIQTRTRQFAKRQHTWFRNLEECTAIEIDGRESTADLTKRIAQQVSSQA
jgi:tRNA dimethylallyltransferase